MAAASAATPVAQGASGIQGQKLRQRCSRAGAARRARSVTSAKAIAEAGAATKLNKAEWNSLGSVCAVLGSQWGDEGKGKLVDILAQVSQRESEKWLSPTPQPFPPRPSTLPFFVSFDANPKEKSQFLPDHPPSPPLSPRPFLNDTVVAAKTRE